MVTPLEKGIRSPAHNILGTPINILCHCDVLIAVVTTLVIKRQVNWVWWPLQYAKKPKNPLPCCKDIIRNDYCNFDFLFQLVKRQAQDEIPTPSKPAPKPAGVKKSRMQKKKKKKDPNEPQKWERIKYFICAHFLSLNNSCSFFMRNYHCLSYIKIV